MTSTITSTSADRRIAGTLRAIAPDVAVLAVLIILAIAGLQPAYGQNTFLIAGIGGLVVGAGVAVAGYLTGLSMLSTVAAAIAAYFLFGTPLTLPSEAVWGVLPSLDSIGALVTGAIFGWSDAVTLHAPLQAPAYIAVLPYAATWVVSFVSVSLACRWLRAGRTTALRTAVVVSPPLILFVATILLGTRDPFFAAARSILFAAVALVWIGWHRRRTISRATGATTGTMRRRVVGVATVVLGAGLVAAVVGTMLEPAAASRFVLRQAVTPPFDPLKYPSPLAGFRKYTSTLERTKLFTVTGLKPGSYIRLATMDSYNGVVWNVSQPGGQSSESGNFELLGHTIPRPPLFTAGATERASISIDKYDDIWLPEAGYATSLDFNHFVGTNPATTVRVNTVTGTAAITSGVSNGLDYTIGVTSQSIPNDKRLADVPPASLVLPPIASVPDIVTAKAKEYAGTAVTAIQKLRNIERSLKKIGYLSHGRASDPVPSRAGEGADRMVQLFSSAPMVGDQEQYATAFALMANQLGYPVRVVMGFKQPAGSGTVTITGNNITAWDEVAFKGVGWIPFFPTPTKTDAPKDQTTQPKLEPQPQVRQPPRTNPTNDQLLTPVKVRNEKQNTKGQFVWPVWATVVVIVLGIPLLLYFVPVGILLLLKRRRRRRRQSGAPDRRAAGAWDELSDGFVEMGFALPRPATRTQVAAALERQSSQQGGLIEDGVVRSLAARTDSAVFGAGQVTDDAIESLWNDVDSVKAGLLAGAGWLRRRLATLRFVRR
jgi:Transglutaminase-like superfamily/TgpA N-terminal domain